LLFARSSAGWKRKRAGESAEAPVLEQQAKGVRLMTAHKAKGLEQVERGLPWEAIVEEWEGKVPHEAIAEAVRLAREGFLEHAAEYSGPSGHRRAG
jgi:hypothetical protein